MQNFGRKRTCILERILQLCIHGIKTGVKFKYRLKLTPLLQILSSSKYITYTSLGRDVSATSVVYGLFTNTMNVFALFLCCWFCLFNEDLVGLLLPMPYFWEQCYLYYSFQINNHKIIPASVRKPHHIMNFMFIKYLIIFVFNTF